MIPGKLFISCPIFYVNSKPHLGHAYTLCLADAWARYAEIRGHPALSPFSYPSTSRLKSLVKSKSPPQSLLSAGTDEHGMKVKLAAQKASLSPKEYCDQISPLFQSLCKVFSINLKDFIRTTEDRHRHAVEEFWRHLDKSGQLYQATYAGWYSTSDEAFYTERELTRTKSSVSVQSSSKSSSTVPTIDNEPVYVVTETGNPVERVEETNFMFRLTSFKDPLHKWLDSGVFLASSSQQIWRAHAHKLVDTALDISVSRPTSRLDWGIPVPDHPDQVVYVWLDALVNYLTVTGFQWTSKKHTSDIPWPPDFQFFGKDILKFHAILWPALLMAVDLPLPRHLICHGHLLVDGEKMSKSRGNVIDPFSERLRLVPKVDTPGRADSEGLRYLLLRSALLSNDVSYSPALAKQVINSELVNCLGNLLSRITSVSVNPNQAIVRINREEAEALFGGSDQDAELLKGMDTLAALFDELWWQNGQPHLAIEHVLSILREANAFVDRHKPWDKEAAVEPEFVISVAAECLRLTGLLLRPVVPRLSARLLRRLGVEKEDAADQRKQPQDRYFWDLGSDKRPLLQRLT
ncbi:Methionine--tRNA ligase, mitochondrial [Clonorchis sinensis]|uniref:Methionine--tRNA ligase, mitochondrial n=1 Tax=Clonorchis sinensis TaxID=79923 RepID=A0A3R7CQH3_CLOSI|nr:Methionine--tRNA ligase, mitochondrial [Clonorchis sinensis]